MAARWVQNLAVKEVLLRPRGAAAVALMPCRDLVPSARAIAANLLLLLRLALYPALAPSIDAAARGSRLRSVLSLRDHAHKIT